MIIEIAIWYHIRMIAEYNKDQFTPCLIEGQEHQVATLRDQLHNDHHLIT